MWLLDVDEVSFDLRVLTGQFLFLLYQILPKLVVRSSVLRLGASH